MDYISTKETAAAWGIHPRLVQQYCKVGRIPGARKYGNSWMIPIDAHKPQDPRRARRDPAEARAAYLTCGLVGLTQYQEPPGTVVLVPAQDVESTGVWHSPEGILPAPGRGSTLDLTYRNDTDAPATVTLHQGSGEDLGPALLTVEVPAGAEVTGQLALEDPTPGVREPFRVCVTPSAPDGTVDGRLSLIQRQETPA